MRRPRVILKRQTTSRFAGFSPRVRRVIARVFLAGVALLVVNALVGDDGLLDSLEAQRRHEELVGDVTRLRFENERLRDEARRLREDPRAVETVAREDLGLIAPGERVFLFNDQPRRAGDGGRPRR